MKNYMEEINEKTKEYYKILSKDFPEFLNDYIYTLSEIEIIKLIKNCDNKEISKSFNDFMKCTKFEECEEYRNDKFCVSRKVKRRYINPIVNNNRIYDISNKAKQKIDNYMNIDISKYVYIDI